MLEFKLYDNTLLNNNNNNNNNNVKFTFKLNFSILNQ